MNYGKKGVVQQQKTLNAKSTKWGRKAALLFFKVFLVMVIAVGIIAASGAVGVVKGIIDTAPDISKINVEPTRFSTFIYDSEGNQTAKLVATNANRIPVSMDKIPENLAHAFVAIEDERFYEHNGIDIKGIMRAFFVGVKNKFHFSEGASTITQQLLKNQVFTDWVSEESFAEKLKRKIQEQYLALELEKVMDKDTILVNYMNTINLGQNTLGVQAASLRYFNKQVSDLTLSECAVIAGITQNPSKYNPITHPDNNAERRQKVLTNMKDQGYITQAEYDEAMADDPYSRITTANEVVGDTTITSYFDDAVTDQVYEDLLDAGYTESQAYTLLYTGGLSIYSTQDPSIQAICDEEFSNEDNYPDNTKWLLSYQLSITKADGSTENHSSEMFKTYFQENGNPSFNLLYSSQDAAYEAISEYQAAVMEEGDEILAETISLTPQPQVTITVEDQSTGYVVAMVGGRGEKTASRTLNRATSSTRSPGSTFKILAVYAPAFDSAGLTLATVQNDAPFNYYDGTPVSNWYDEDSYRGLCSLREGIYASLNIVAVKTLTQITPQLGFDYVQRFGITTLETAKEINGKIYSDIQQTLALGGLTNGVTNYELNAAYAAIANGGAYNKPKLYTKVVDHDGNVILDNTETESTQVIKETTAFLLTSAMQDTVTNSGGTATSVNFGNMAIAGKTGTSSKYVDVWFAGYTPYYTATTWAGYDNNTYLTSSSEKNLARKLWRAVMERVHENLPSKSFETPAGIVQATVCSRSGKLPIAGLCDGTLKTEYFAEGTVPTDTCNVHYQGAICAYSGLVACSTCPFQTEGIVEVTPPEDSSLWSGSSIVSNGDTSSYNYCPHNEAFMSDPNAEATIAAQRAEMQGTQAAAAAAAEAAAAAQTEVATE
jgi:penicillin-binding protein 1A